jgi:hypothetical protein
MELDLNASKLIGWREWVGLPGLNINRIKAKIDTGAKTAALHAFKVDVYHEQGKQKVRFAIHPRQKSTRRTLICHADLYDIRSVTDSGGHKERYVIRTEIILGSQRKLIEITLTSRDDMRFRMLLGRSALKDFLVDPTASYLLKDG